MSTNAIRKYTVKILDMVDEGLLDKNTLITDLLNWMSEDDVAEYYMTALAEDDADEDDE